MSRRPTILAMLAASAALVAVSGCSDGKPNTATTSSAATAPETSAPNSAPTTTTDETYGAPKVSTPIDSAKFLPQPCSVLAVHVLQGLGLPAQGKGDPDRQLGPECVWQSSGGLLVSISFDTFTKKGLASLYRAHADGKVPAYWEETSVDGFPAVFAGTLDDERPQGTCQLSVGVADTLTMDLHVIDRPAKQGSCNRAKQVASAAIATMRGAS